MPEFGPPQSESFWHGCGTHWPIVPSLLSHFDPSTQLSCPPTTRHPVMHFPASPCAVSQMRPDFTPQSVSTEQPHVPLLVTQTGVAPVH
jgi:hypothetical protein